MDEGTLPSTTVVVPRVISPNKALVKKAQQNRAIEEALLAYSPKFKTSKQWHLNCARGEIQTDSQISFSSISGRRDHMKAYM